MHRYATYKAVQKQPGGHQLVAFTRILHRTKPDILYDEVLLFVLFSYDIHVITHLA